MASPRTDFSSEGYDLDAASAAAADGGGSGEVIYEIGGTATTSVSHEPTRSKEEGEEKSGNEAKAKAETETDPCAKSEVFKAEGNALFKSGNYLDAIDRYTEAIEACPGPFDGEELLRSRDEWNEKERERMLERHREETERRRRDDEERYRRRREEGDGAGAMGGKGGASNASGSAEGGNDNDDDDDEKKDAAERRGPAEFRPPHHPYGKNLAIYYCNRAACHLYLERFEDALSDCDVAILLDKTYVKAYMRRMTAHERLDKTEEALKDAKTALFYDPSNVNTKRNVKRLEKIEEERMEKLKEETLGKLKDLGNSILGNFGLSLDNFKADKDPNTGGYSISFQQNK